MTSLVKVAAQSALSVFGIRTEQQPSYRVLETLGDVEVRLYEPYRVIETTVDVRDEGAARFEAYNVLAPYYFGHNSSGLAIDMTAPVSMHRDVPLSVAMEPGISPAPMTMRLALPDHVSGDEAPAPLDQRVELREIAEETLAVLSFRGSWSEEQFDDKSRLLISALDGTDCQIESAPLLLLYDPPSAIPFLRRNEVAVRVALG